MPLTDSFRGIWPVIETNGSAALSHVHQRPQVKQTVHHFRKNSSRQTNTRKAYRDPV